MGKLDQPRQAVSGQANSDVLVSGSSKRGRALVYTLADFSEVNASTVADFKPPMTTFLNI